MQNTSLFSLLLAVLTSSTAAADTDKTPGGLPGFPGLQDRAFTVADQYLLNTIREGVLEVLGATEGWSPVHVIAKRGTVTLLGIVATPQERERVLSVVEEVYGVRRIVDGLEIASERQRAREGALYAKAGLTRSEGIARSSGITASEGVTPSGGLTPSGGVTATGGTSSAGIPSSGSGSGSNSNGGSLADQSTAPHARPTDEPAAKIEHDERANKLHQFLKSNRFQHEPHGADKYSPTEALKGAAGFSQK